MAKVRYTEDECILALQLYLMLPRKDIRRDNPQIIQLSDFLTSKGHPHNANSIKMKLENFKAFDPLYLGKSLSNGSDMDKRVWERFYATGFTDLSKALRNPECAYLIEIRVCSEWRILMTAGEQNSSKGWSVRTRIYSAVAC